MWVTVVTVSAGARKVPVSYMVRYLTTSVGWRLAVDVERIMQFRRSGQRDERRRRVLRDDAGAQKEQTDKQAVQQTPSSKEGGATVRGYTDAALAEHQPTLIDFVPVRIWKAVLLLFVGGLLVVGVQTLHHYQPLWQSFVGGQLASGLDISHRGSLATWLSASLLSLTAVLSLIIYSMRRHKVDDYRGRYRIWVWAAMFAILASIDIVTGLHDIVTGLALKAFGTPLVGDGSIWWMIGALIVLLLPTILIMLDIHRSRASLTTGILSLGCFVAAAVFQLRLIGQVADDMNSVVASSCSMSAFLFLAATTMFYARYVCLDAHDLLAVRVEKPKKQKKPKPEAKTKRVAEEKPEVKAKPKEVAKKERPLKVKKAKKQNAKKTTPEPSSKQEPSSPSNNQMGSPAAALGLSQAEYEGLSKAERRRLRKQLRRQNKAA